MLKSSGKKPCFLSECRNAGRFLLQRILMTAESGLNMFLDILSNNHSRKSHKRSGLALNFINLIWSSLLFLFFPWYFSDDSSFILWSPSWLRSGPSPFITLLHFCVYEFCFTCSKDPHFDPEGREENKERLPFSFKNLLIGDLRASNKPLLLFFAVSFLLISHSSDLCFPPPFFLSVKWMKNLLPLICSIFQNVPYSLSWGCGVVRTSILYITALYFSLHSFPRSARKNKNNLCTLFTVESQFFFLHPNDVFGTFLSEETLLIPQKIFHLWEESLTQYLEN